MGKCTLAIEPRDPKRTYEPGDRIDVVVHVETSAAVRCKALIVALCWRTHGKGNVDEKECWSGRLFSGELPAGRMSYPCAIPVPRITPGMPRTYHGHYVNIDWYVRVRADIPWAFDPKEELPVFLAPSSSAPSVDIPIEWNLKAVELTGKMGCQLFLAVLFIGGGFYAVPESDWIALLLFAAGLFIVYRYIRELRLRKRVGRVELGHAPEPAMLGEALHGLLEIVPPRDFRTKSISLTLRATESATSGSGTNETTYTHVAFERSRLTAEDALLFGGEPFTADLALDLPLDAAASFEAPSNRVTWSLELTVIPRGAKALSCTTELVVRHR